MLRIIAVALFSCIFFSCSSREPIKLGLVADFSGRTSLLATHGRNAMSMAVDELNEKGGILGRPVEFISVDHKNDLELCRQVTQELILEGADVIIGPMVSGMAASVIEGAKESGVLIIGPTVSTDALTGIDDNFIRGVAPASDQGKKLARLVNQREIRSVAIVYDAKNKTYYDALLKGYEEEIGDCDSCIKKIIPFTGREDFTGVVQQLKSSEAEGFILISNGLDTAAIAQLYSRDNKLPQLFTGSWAKVTNVIEYGGRAIEGMLSVDTFANEVPLEREMAFYSRYNTLFSMQPNIAAIAAYESVMLYAAAVEKAGSLESEDVKKAIFNMGEIEGIRDTFSIDEFGDGVRELSIFVVRDGVHILLNGRK